MKVVTRIGALVIATTLVPACAEQPGKKKDDEKSKDEKKADKKVGDAKVGEEAKVDPPKTDKADG